MIKLEVLDSPDLLSIGTMEINFHHITIGKSLKNNLIFNDPDIEKEHALLRLSKRGLIFECPNEFLLNDKRVSGTVLIKQNDTIVVGTTKFKIIQYDISTLLDANEYYKYIEGLEVSDPELANLISALEEEFIYQASKEADVLEE
jgi:pSer/pThr/pTyr-binding forkhead associated (FHA) protein